MEYKNHMRFAETVAHLMDDQFNVFGISFGLDPVFGLFPGLGDLVGVLVVIYFVWLGIQIKVPGEEIKNMIINSGVDFLIGILPIVGDAADTWYKSNLRNWRILQKYYHGVIDGEEVST